MGIDFENGFEELLEHFGHKIVIVKYSPGIRNAHTGLPLYPPCNVAIECETCECVLIDFDRPEEGTPCHRTP